MVAKQLFKGQKFTESHFLALLSNLILAIKPSPILLDFWGKRMKAQMLGSCATVRETKFQVSYLKMLCIRVADASQSLNKLNVKSRINHWKNIAAPRLSVLQFLRWNYVMPKSITGYGTRSSVKCLNILKVYKNIKRADQLARFFTTNCYNNGNEFEVTQALDTLKINAKKNDITKVNESVNFILGLNEFWVFCYESIKSNPGTQSLGGSAFEKPNEKPKTLEGNDLDFFSKLTASVLNGSFKFGPTKNFEIHKPSKGSKLIEITDFRDKIVEKGMAIILECITDHIFLECSFGFRKGRSCHAALAYIKKKVPSGFWAVEGDMNQCFDNFDQKRLVSLIKKKYTSNQVFIDLLYKAIKVKIIRINGTFFNKMSTVQNAIVSPILCNVFLHELDFFITNGTELAKYRNGKPARSNPKFVSLLKPTKDEFRMAEQIKKTKGKKKMWKFFHKWRIFKLKQAKKLNIKRTIFKGGNRKLAYVRYADDFIVFVWGSKNDCLEIQTKIKNFLIGNLNLKFSDDKTTKITYLKKKKAEFLGFLIWQSPSYIPSIKKDVNPMGKIDRLKMHSKYRAATMQVPRLRITFSSEKILTKLVDRGLLRFKHGKFFPTSFKPALQYDIPNIVNYLKFVFRNICNYFGFANNWYDSKSIYNYFGRFTVAMTLAHKTKSKVPKIFKKYGVDLTITDHNNKVIAKFGRLSNKTFRNNFKNNNTDDFVAPNIDDLSKETFKILFDSFKKKT